MIIKTNLVPNAFDAITCYPFIFIRPDSAKDEGLVAHEMVHYEEQRDAFVLPWLVKYWLSDSFRFAAEVRGYRKQIAVGTITPSQAAFLLMQYGLDVSYDSAIRELTK